MATFAQIETAQYEEKLAYARSSGNRHLEASTLHTLAINYSKEKDVLNYPTAVKYFTQASSIYIGEGDLYDYYKCILNVIFIYDRVLNDPAKAVESGKYAIKIQEPNSDPDIDKKRNEALMALNFAKSKICSDCGRIIDLNGQLIDGYYCVRCYKRICPECQAKHPRCHGCEIDYYYCEDCQSKPLATCPGCGQTFCRTCQIRWKTCQCGVQYCEDCYSRFEECGTCGRSYCRNCASLIKICPNCESDCCPDCIEEDQYCRECGEPLPAEN